MGGGEGGRWEGGRVDFDFLCLEMESMANCLCFFFWLFLVGFLVSFVVCLSGLSFFLSFFLSILLLALFLVC